ncbi:hypothetical protein AYK20_06900 [Thermoplasmatales archaeon SG8-52-1]|nr:MAG: hypothetical protein AYK20_06900 [Thermoplasmatales archaeon SG8-52-1]
MNKILPFFVVGILVLGGLGAVSGTKSNDENIISEKINFSTPNFSETGDYISIELSEATNSYISEDKPMVPAVTKVYTLPFGTKIDNVKVTFADSIVKGISKPVEPAPETLPVSINTVHNIKKTNELMTYEDIEIYPEQRYSYRVAAGLDNEQHVTFLVVSLNPIQYKPKENKVYYAKSATINVKYTPPANPVNFAEEYDYLIIAPAQFETALQTLVDHKNNLDPPVKTIMFTLDEIPSGVGIDEQEDIKYFIKDAVETMGITYVLLVGAGIKDKEIFPVRYAWISDDIEDNFPSDLYYADIYNDTGGFSNWDRDGDERYCEYPYDIPNVDVIPDVYLARLPCNNVQEVNTIVGKIIEYKAHNKMTKRILQAGGDTFTGNSQIEGEYANEKVMEKLPGYTALRCWASDGSLTKPKLASGWKKSVDFVDWSGHGSPISWATHPPNDEHTWIPPETLISQYAGWSYYDFDAYMINNDYKYPVVFYNSCSNNKFSYKDPCLGWVTLSRKGGGGIATFAASGIGYGVPGNEVSRRMGWMEVRCFEEIMSTKILGQSWHNNIEDYYTTFAGSFDRYDYKTMVEYAMFADPTLVVEDGDDPRSKPVNKPVYTGILDILMELFPRLEKLLDIILAKLI